MDTVVQYIVAILDIETDFEYIAAVDMKVVGMEVVDMEVGCIEAVEVEPVSVVESAVLYIVVSLVQLAVADRIFDYNNYPDYCIYTGLGSVYSCQNHLQELNVVQRLVQ